MIIIPIIVTAIVLIIASCIFESFDFEGTSVTCGAVGLIFLVVTLLMGTGMIFENINTDAILAKMTQRKQVLEYQLEADVYDNDNDNGLKELYSKIQEYNEDVAQGQEARNNVWIRPFYGKYYDSLELIELPEIEENVNE